MTTEQDLREKLRKISALFDGATTSGERKAAAAASQRVLAALGECKVAEPAIEMQFSIPDRCSRKLFLALCRRHHLKPYRYPRQRSTTVLVRAQKTFLETTLWPEYLELKTALDVYLNEATDRIIREEVFADTDDVEERAG